MKPTIHSTPIKKSGRRQAELDFFNDADLDQDFISTVTFSGTESPREFRALIALLEGPIPREILDKVTGCSNGPALVASLRAKGLGTNGLVCTLVSTRDRDGNPVRRGVYWLSRPARRAVMVWVPYRPDTPLARSNLATLSILNKLPPCVMLAEVAVDFVMDNADLALHETGPTRTCLSAIVRHDKQQLGRAISVTSSELELLTDGTGVY